MVFLPPRHGKSEFIDRYFTSWILGKFPDVRILLASYEADFAATWGRKSRDVLEEWGPELFGIRVSSKSSAANRWDIEGHEGGMVTAGVAGPITGKGADIGIIDDPVKNDQEAESPLIQERNFEWYKATFRTRLHKGGAIILIMTRWHENDLAGKLLKAQGEDGEEWEVISLPAIADKNDPLGRLPGQALCPELFDESALANIKIAVGSKWWMSLYQQRPTPQEGGMLKRNFWKYYTVPPTRFDQILLSWDMTFKDAESSKTGNPDYVVGQVWGRAGADKYLLDQVRDRMDFPTTIRSFRNLAAKWPKARKKLVEDKANGPAVISTLKHEIPGIVAWDPKGETKVSRVNAVLPDIEAGNVYLPDPSIAPWVNDFVEECAAFPRGANDDQVDSMTQALLNMTSKGYSVVNSIVRKRD